MNKIIEYVVTFSIEIGQVKVKAKDEEEALKKVDLIDFFNLGYNGNLHKRVKKINMPELKL